MKRISRHLPFAIRHLTFPTFVICHLSFVIWLVACHPFIEEELGGEGHPCFEDGSCNEGFFCCAGTCCSNEGSKCIDYLCVEVGGLNQPCDDGNCNEGLYCCNGTCIAESIWTDTATGYEWQNHATDGKYDWDEAISCCDNLTWAGESGWRLPTREELETILTDTEHNGCYWKEGLCGPCNWFWSSSSYAASTNYAWGVYFGNGNVAGFSKTYTGHARCARGGP